MVVGGDENKIIHLTMDDERSEGSSRLSSFSPFLFLSLSLFPLPKPKRSGRTTERLRIMTMFTPWLRLFENLCGMWLKIFV